MKAIALSIIRIGLGLLVITLLMQSGQVSQAKVGASSDPQLPGNHSATTFPIVVRQLSTSATLPNVMAATLTWRGWPVLPRYSLDGGYTWLTLPLPADLNYYYNPPGGVLVAPRNDPNQPVRLIVSIGNSPSTLLRTGDFGATWVGQTFPVQTECQTHPVFGHGIGGLLNSPADPTQLYFSYWCYIDVGFADGYLVSLFRSLDSGLTWQAGEFLTSWAPMRRVLVSPLLSDRVYRHDVYWYQSDDGGDTWQQSSFQDANITLALDSSESGRLYSVTEPLDIEVWEGRTSLNGGANWTTWASMPCPYPATSSNWLEGVDLLAVPGPPTTLLLQCWFGLFRSFDAGNSWEQLSTISGQMLLADQASPSRVLWVRSDGLWASVNAGTSWTHLTSNYGLFEIFIPMLSR